MDENTLTTLKTAGKDLIFYGNLEKQPALRQARKLGRALSAKQYEKAVMAYLRLLAALQHCPRLPEQPGGWQSLLLSFLREDENPYTLASEKDAGKPFRSLAGHDLEELQKLFRLDWKDIRKCILENSARTKLPQMPVPANSGGTSAELDRYFREESPEECCRYLESQYARQGTGELARYQTFRWSRGELRGIDNPDPVRLGDLFQYERQRETVLRNTNYFLRGLPANNILLYGDRGTGKSSTVKAVAASFYESGLRLIEVTKHSLFELPALLEKISGRGLRFLLFVDDLAFENNETSYRELKSFLEGGIEKQADNVLIYATSNRRHLIREYFSDRDSEDEIHGRDTLEEKLSLSDRFGISLRFDTPAQESFLQIVTGMAARRELDIGKDRLQEEALQWAIRHNGTSPRSAVQFLNALESRLTLAAQSWVNQMPPGAEEA